MKSTPLPSARAVQTCTGTVSTIARSWASDGLRSASVFTLSSCIWPLSLLPAHGDFARQLDVLPGQLLEHAVDRLRTRVELGRPAVRCDAPRKIALDNCGCGAADFVHLEKKRAANHPPERG